MEKPGDRWHPETFGSGEEFSEFVDLKPSGSRDDKRSGKCTMAGKIRPQEWQRLTGECSMPSDCRILESMYFADQGYSVSKQERHEDTIVNVCGRSEEDYCEVVERLADEPVDMLEIDISCPNVKEGGHRVRTRIRKPQ